MTASWVNSVLSNWDEVDEDRSRDLAIKSLTLSQLTFFFLSKLSRSILTIGVPFYSWLPLERVAKTQLIIEGSNMIFHSLTFTRSRGKC